MCRAKVKAAEKHRSIYVRLGWLGLLGAEVSKSPAVADGVEEPAVAGSTWVTTGSERGAALHQTGAAPRWSLGWRNRLRPGLRSHHMMSLLRQIASPGKESFWLLLTPRSCGCGRAVVRHVVFVLFARIYPVRLAGDGLNDCEEQADEQHKSFHHCRCRFPVERSV